MLEHRVTRLRERDDALTRMLAASFVALFTVLACSVVLSSPAHASLSRVGPSSPDNGFPIWYEDADGLQLELCLEPQNPMCLQPLVVPRPNDPVSFPNNYPAEAFYWSADVPSLPLKSGGNVLLTMGQEASFLPLQIAPGNRTTFSRIRIRADIAAPGTYRITHPYGVDTFTVGGGKRAINFTQDILPVPEDFTGSLRSDNRIGPFLRWTPNPDGSPDPSLPAGYVGNPNIPHTVTGSPEDTNFLLVERRVGDAWVEEGRTDQFLVSGKIHGVTVFASPKGGTYNADKNVTLTASDPAAEVHYTLDGSEPTAASPIYNPASGIDITDGNPAGNGEATTVLKYKAFVIDPTGAVKSESPVLSETYSIDTVAPEAPSVPDLDAASDSGSSDSDNITNNTTPTFSGTAEANSTVKVLVDGVQKGSARATSAGDYSVTTSDLASLADGTRSITVTATDAAGNASGSSGPLDITLDRFAQKAAANPKGGLYTASKSVTLSSEDGAKIYFTTDKTDPIVDPSELFDPNNLISVNTNTELRSMAVDLAGNHSQIATENYVIDTIGPKLRANLSTGSYNGAQSLRLNPEPGAAVFYTVNGSRPTRNSSRYTGPISIRRTMTIKAIAFDAAGNAYNVLERKITIRKASRTSLNLATTNLKLGKSRIISGSVSPSQPSGKVKLTIRKPGKDVVKTLALKGSRYRFTYRPPVKGLYSVQVSFAQDVDNLASKSVIKSFRVIQ